MIRLQAYGIRARIDLCDHHLVISRPGGIVGTASDQIVPFTSIKSVAFHRPTFFRPGRIALFLAGGQPRQQGRSADDNTVFFGKEQLGKFEQLLQYIEAAIAMPSIERMAMDASWRKEANARITPARPEPKPTRAVLERIDPPRQSSYNPNTGADYDETGTYGHQAYHHPGVGRGDEPPLSPSVGELWRDTPFLGKIFLVGLVLAALVAMCSMPGEEAAPDPIQPLVDATEAPDQAAISSPATQTFALPDGTIDSCYHVDECGVFKLIRSVVVRGTADERLIRAELLHGVIPNAQVDQPAPTNIAWDRRRETFFALCSKRRPSLVYQSGADWTVQPFDFIGGVPGVAQNGANIYQALCHGFYRNELADQASALGYQTPDGGTDEYSVENPLSLIGGPSRAAPGQPSVAAEAPAPDTPNKAPSDDDMYAPHAN